ncbi:unnamed protein product [Urochloa humidicola]
MSRAKRKVEELGEQVVSAAVGDVFARTMAAAVRRYAAPASVGEQMERLGTLVVMVHSAVEAAEGVHIRSWWLRRWLWRLRDAALDGDEVLRSLTRRRQPGKAEEEEEEAGGSIVNRRLWNAARRVFRSARSLLLVAGGDDSAARLSAAVARLEGESAYLADFLKLLHMEIRMPPPPPPPPVTILKLAGSQAYYHPGRSVVERERYSLRSCSCSSTTTCTRRRWYGYDDAPDPSSRRNLVVKQEILHGVLDVPPPPRCRRRHDEEEEETSSSSLGAESEEDYYLSYSSYKEHNAARRKFALMIVWRRRIRRRAMNKKLTTRTPSSDHLWTTPARLRVLVADIRGAISAGDRAEVHGKRWLAEWRRELQGVADRADSVVVGDDDEVRRTARTVHTAAAHLQCFVTLVRIAVSSHDIPTSH